MLTPGLRRANTSNQVILYEAYHGFFALCPHAFVAMCALTGMKATTGSDANPLKPCGATPMIVNFAGPMSSIVPSASLRPPNCVCQNAYDRTATRAPSG